MKINTTDMQQKKAELSQQFGESTGSWLCETSKHEQMQIKLKDKKYGIIVMLL
jgi:hypothetical protein